MIAAGYLQPWHQLGHASFHGASTADWTTGPSSELISVQHALELQQWLTQEENLLQLTEQQQIQQQQQVTSSMLHSSSTAAGAQLQHSPQQLLWQSTAAFQSSQSLQQHVLAVCGPMVSPAAAAAATPALGSGGTDAPPVPAAAACEHSGIELSVMDSMTVTAAAALRAPAAAGVGAGSNGMTVRRRSQKTIRSGRSVSGTPLQVVEVLRSHWVQAVHEACVAAAAANAANDTAHAAHAAAVAAKAAYAKVLVSASDILDQKTLSRDQSPKTMQQMRFRSSTATPNSTDLGCRAQQVMGTPGSSPSTSGHTEAIPGAMTAQAGSAAAAAGSGLAAAANCLPVARVPGAVAVCQELVSPFYPRQPKQQRQQYSEVQHVRDAWSDAWSGAWSDDIQFGPGQELLCNKHPAVLQSCSTGFETGTPSAAAVDALDATLSSSLTPEDTCLQEPSKEAAAAAAAEAAGTSKLAQQMGSAAVQVAAVLGRDAGGDCEAPLKRCKLSGLTAAGASAERKQSAVAALLADWAVVDQFLTYPHAGDAHVEDMLEVSAAAAEPATSVASAAAAADQVGVKTETDAQHANVSQQWSLQDSGALTSVAVSLPLQAASAESLEHSSTQQQHKQHGLKDSYKFAATSCYCSSVMLPVSALGGSTPAGSTAGVYPNGSRVHGADFNSCGLTPLTRSNSALDAAPTAAVGHLERSFSLQQWTSGVDLDSCAAGVAAGLGLCSDAGSSFWPTTITSGSEGPNALPSWAYGVEVAAARLQNGLESETGVAAAGAETCNLQPLLPTTAQAAGLSLSRTVTSGQADLAAATTAAGQGQQASTADLAAAATAAASSSSQQSTLPASLTAAKLRQVLQHYKVGRKQ